MKSSQVFLRFFTGKRSHGAASSSWMGLPREAKVSERNPMSTFTPTRAFDYLDSAKIPYHLPYAHRRDGVGMRPCSQCVPRNALSEVVRLTWRRGKGGGGRDGKRLGRSEKGRRAEG